MRARFGLVVVTIIVVSIAAIMALSLSRGAGANVEDEEHEAVHLIRHGNSTTSCGIERWKVKTGMDPSAQRVSMQPVSTNIQHLRSRS